MQQPVLNALDKNNQINREELLRLLVNNNVKVYYQPIYNPNTKELLGLEALSRLHYRDEVLLPGKFIKQFINNGIASHLDMHVISTVFKQLSLWRKEEVVISVNLSLNQFKDVYFSKRLVQIIQRHGVLPEAIKIEVTEAQRIIDFKEVAKKLGDLKDRGFLISLDDFGSGYSTLIMLKEFPFIDEVKLDKTFLQNIESDSNKRLIEEFGCFIKKMGHQFIVEGVETQEQLDFLKRVGVVDGVQGFFLSKPKVVDPNKEVHSFFKL